MLSYITDVINSPEVSIATQQRAVYNYHESLNSDEIIDIYSPEWQQRIASWHDWFKASVQDLTGSSSSFEDIDFRVFFLAHPIAAFALWRLLQACYEIDRAVCGTSVEALDEIAEWQQLKPFRYLKSEEVRGRWMVELRLLKEQIEEGYLVEEALKVRIYDILRGVERLEDAMAALEENFSVNLKGVADGEKMLGACCGAADERCLMIAELLKGEGAESADEEESEDDELSSSQNLSSGSRLDSTEVQGGRTLTNQNMPVEQLGFLTSYMNRDRYGVWVISFSVLAISIIVMREWSSFVSFAYIIGTLCLLRLAYIHLL